MKLIKVLFMVMSCVYRLMIKSREFFLKEISDFEDEMDSVQAQINRLEES